MTPKSPAGGTRKQLRRLRLGIDIPFVAAVLALLGIGLVMVYSASMEYAIRVGTTAESILARQAVIALAGCVAAAVISLIDYHKYRGLVVWGMLILLVMLLAVLLVVEESRLGAKRGLFGGSVQPSELAKLGIVVYLAFWLYSKRDQFQHFALGLLPMMVIMGITAGLILMQPDISAAMTVIALGGLLFFIAGGDWRQILLVMAAAIVIALLILTISDRAQVRVNDYIAGLTDPSLASPHLKWSMQAIINGGLFGVGIGKSTVKFSGLPVAATDSIYAVLVEETGLVGGAVVIALYLVILWRGLAIARKAPDLLGRLLATGITLWILAEAMINMGVMVNLIPFAGNALPLISAGGSSLFVTLVGIGIVLNVGRLSQQAQPALDGRNFGTVVDLRRRDRRGGVSRPVRPAGPQE